MTVEIKQLTTKIGNTYYRITKGYEFSITSTDSSVVTKIVYCRKGYNKGHQGDYPSYKVEFEDPQFKLIIPEKNIENIVVETIQKENKDLTNIELKLPTEELPEELPEETMTNLSTNQLTNENFDNEFFNVMKDTD